MNQAQEDQINAQVMDDLTTMVSLSYSAAEAKADGDQEEAEECVAAYLDNLNRLTGLHALLLLDKAISVIAGQFAVETGREDLIPPAVTLDDMPPLD